MKTKLWRMLWRQFSISLWRAFLCPFCQHQDKNADGSWGNFCEACLLQTNPKAYQDYAVHLRDGDRIKVSAVNHHHARSVAMYGNELKIKGHTGEPMGKKAIHQSQIVKVELSKTA